MMRYLVMLNLSYLFSRLHQFFIFVCLIYTFLPVLCFLSAPLLFWSSSLAVFSGWDKSPCSLLLPLPVLVSTYLFSSVRHIVLLLCQSSLFILRPCGLDSWWLVVSGWWGFMRYCYGDDCVLSQIFRCQLELRFFVIGIMSTMLNMANI